MPTVNYQPRLQENVEEAKRLIETREISSSDKAFIRLADSLINGKLIPVEYLKLLENWANRIISLHNQPIEKGPGTWVGY